MGAAVGPAGKQLGAGCVGSVREIGAVSHFGLWLWLQLAPVVARGLLGGTAAAAGAGSVARLAALETSSGLSFVCGAVLLAGVVMDALERWAALAAAAASATAFLHACIPGTAESPYSHPDIYQRFRRSLTACSVPPSCTTKPPHLLVTQHWKRALNVEDYKTQRQDISDDRSHQQSIPCLTPCLALPTCQPRWHFSKHLRAAASGSCRVVLSCTNIASGGPSNKLVQCKGVKVWRVTLVLLHGFLGAGMHIHGDVGSSCHGCTDTEASLSEWVVLWRLLLVVAVQLFHCDLAICYRPQRLFLSLPATPPGSWIISRHQLPESTIRESWRPQ